MRLLVLNAGSSSLKFDLFEPGGGAPPPGERAATGAVERIGGRSVMTTRVGPAREETAVEAGDHGQATGLVLDWLQAGRALTGGPDAVAHRVVHAGERFSAPALLDDAVLSAILDVAPLAPLHNEPAIAAIQASRRTLGGQTPMVAVFDTTFHRSLPPRAAIYALPRAVAERHGIRRYGFHGLAHRSLVERWSALSGVPATQARLVTLQLGNGASAAAVAHGRSIDTTMGFTPLEGLVMGTRSGDLDPAIPGYLARQERLSLDQVDALLNGRSGLLGVSGTSADMADLLRAEEGGDERAALAIDLFCYRARKQVGAFMAALGGADALVFGGGIGERSPAVRARICDGMAWCGLALDDARNARALGCDARISGDGSKPSAWVVAVDEASVIAIDALACLEGPSP